MLELESDVSEIYLHPGEAYLACKPSIIRTILGSCVGVSFWSPRLRIGALTHSQLPRCPIRSRPPVSSEGHRYVDYSLREIARQMDHLGVLRTEVQVKLFGGADVLLVTESSSKPTVGRLNCEVALEVLQAEGYLVTASSLGGKAGLNIRFDTRTGDVWLRRLH